MTSPVAAPPTAHIVCFGEMLLRLAAPGRELLFQSPELAARFGGAEANVAVSLARLGHNATMVSAVPAGALGEAALGEVRRHGVETTYVLQRAGRLGLYFVAPGAGQRPTDVLYDRAGSAFALSGPTNYPWDAIFSRRGWFHVTGVTAAVSAGAAMAALDAAQIARRVGYSVSIDCNFRPKLWAARGGDPVATLDPLYAQADLLFASHRDLELITGRAIPGDGQERNKQAAEIAFARYPNLKTFAGTNRTIVSTDHNDLSGYLFTREGSWSTQRHSIFPIVDRIGGGDAFSAGLLHGLIRGSSLQTAVDFAVAAACLKHAIPGDFNLAGEEDINALMSGRQDVKR